MHALRGRGGPAFSPGVRGPRSHPRLQGPTPTHLAIYHHPQPRQLIASPRARPRARRGRSPRPARGAAGRPAAELMARPPVPARPGAPWPSPMPLPLSAPLLASPRSRPLRPRCSVPPELSGLGTGGRGQRDPAPAPPSPPAGARGGPRRASSGTRSACLPAGRTRRDQGAGRSVWRARGAGRRAHVTPPRRAHAPRTVCSAGLVSCVPQPSRLRSTHIPAGFRITVTGAEAGWTWRAWTLCHPGIPTPPAGLSLVDGWCQIRL